MVKYYSRHVNLLPSECCLLISFANSLDTDQAQQNVGPDLDTQMVFPKEFSVKVDFEKKLDDNKACKVSQGAKS